MVKKIPIYDNSDLQHMWKIKPEEASVLFASLQNYVNYATIEVNRYHATEEELNEDARLKMTEAEDRIAAMKRGEFDRLKDAPLNVGVDQELMSKRILDHIFIFNCCAIAQDHLEKIAELDNDPKISALWAQLKPLFRDANAVRNHFEHIVDRLTNPNLNIRNFANVSGDEIDFGFKQFNAKDALDVAREAYEGLLQILIERPFEPPAPRV
jgi:hypothetical protein